MNAFNKFERVLRFGIRTAGSAWFTPSIDDLGCRVLLNRRTGAVARGCATRLGSRWRCGRFKLLQLGLFTLRVRSSLQNNGKLPGTAVAQSPMALRDYLRPGR